MASYYKYSANMNDRTYFTSVVTNSAGKDKRYFSNVESEIYFGDKEIDDIYQFQFSIDEKVLPIYGYNCYYASELVSGQRLVQGQFVVNYTNGQLVKTILGEIENSVYHTILEDKYHPGGGSISDPMYNKSFDIMIGYGYYNIQEKETYNATCQTIIGAKINGMQKVIDSTGQPIMEVYTFTAKDFIEENISEVTPGDEEGKNKNNGKNNKDSIPLNKVCSNSLVPIEVSTQDDIADTYEKCLHFTHDIIFTSSVITAHITEKSKGAEIIKIEKPSLVITDSFLDSTNVKYCEIPVKYISKETITFEPEVNVSNVLNNLSKYIEDPERRKYVFGCLKYTITVKDGDKERVEKVEFDTARIYAL